MAARAVLVVGRGADAGGRVVEAERVLGAPRIAQPAQAGGVHRLLGDVAMRAGKAAGECKRERGGGTPQLRSA